MVDNFLSKLPLVNSRDELCDLICELGLFYDDRPIYGKYTKYMKHDRSGSWQNPYELSTFLWETRELFIKHKISSYLDIGTFNGYTFFIISNFLKTFVNKDIKIVTIDPIDSKTEEIKPYIEQYCKQCTSFDMLNENFDLIFIDGSHEDDWPMNDFKNALKMNSKFVFFHDIVDLYCPAVNKTWETVSKHYKTIEFCKSSVANVFGIGLVFVCNDVED